MRATEDVPRETQDRLAVYAEMLRRWNARIRLTGLDAANVSAQIEESLRLRRYAPAHISSALDIGSGNGLPALPLAIACGIPYVLVESDRRKAAFLREVARELACPVTVAAQRIEDMPESPHDLITARAFARLPRLLALAYPRQAHGAVCLFPKGRSAAEELAEARQDWSFDCAEEPAAAGCVVRIGAIRPKAPPASPLGA